MTLFMSEASGPDDRAAPLWQFSLGGILLLITLIAFCLALIRLAPCAGVMLTLVCVPAGVRTALSARHRARLGERMTLTEKTGEFFSSFLIVLWIEMMAGFSGVVVASLFAVSAALLFEASVAVGLALIPGGLVSLTVLIGLMWMLRPDIP